MCADTSPGHGLGKDDSLHIRRNLPDRQSLRSSVHSVFEVRVLHAVAVAHLQQVAFEGPCRERAEAARRAGIAQAAPPLVPGPRVIEPEGDGGVVLSIRAQLHVWERVISQPEYSALV